MFVALKSKNFKKGLDGVQDLGLLGLQRFLFSGAMYRVFFSNNLTRNFHLQLNSEICMILVKYIR